MTRSTGLRLTTIALALLVAAGCAVRDAGGTTPTQPAVAAPPVAAPVLSSPGATSVPAIAFPAVAKPKTRGEMLVYANKLLYERSGKLCITQTFGDPGGVPNWNAMLSGLKEPTGVLEDGVSFVGDLPGAFGAFNLEPSVELRKTAFGLGRVPASRALPQLPQGTWVDA